MKEQKRISGNLLSTLALALAAAFLPGSNVRAVDAKTQLSSADAQFIQDEAAAGTALVEAAKLGGTKAQHKEVKAFARMLAADHTKSNTELAVLAARKGISLPTKPAAKHQDIQEKLDQASGADFDKEFLSMISSSHKKCVKNFKEASEDSEDRDVKAWAAKMLPKLQAHLDKAEKLRSGSNANEATGSPKTSATQPDNTARNERDRDQQTLTPLDQGGSGADIDITARIRREITDLKGLSANAKNVKIITRQGHVTLRGPVNSADEKRIIGEIATRIASAEHTDNQLEIRSASAN